MSPRRVIRQNRFNMVLSDDELAMLHYVEHAEGESASHILRAALREAFESALSQQGARTKSRAHCAKCGEIFFYGVDKKGEPVDEHRVCGECNSDDLVFCSVCNEEPITNPDAGVICSECWKAKMSDD